MAAAEIESVSRPAPLSSLRSPELFDGLGSNSIARGMDDSTKQPRFLRAFKSGDVQNVNKMRRQKQKEKPGHTLIQCEEVYSAIRP